MEKKQHTAHCTLQTAVQILQILEWQVMNKKMNSSSMEHVQNQHFTFNSRKGPSECF